MKSHLVEMLLIKSLLLLVLVLHYHVNDMFLTGYNFSVNRLEKIIILLCASFGQIVLFTTFTKNSWTEGRVLA